VPIRLEDPIVAAALITGASAVAVAIVNGLFQTICTWMQNRSKKPPANKPRRKQRKKRHRPSELARPPPHDDVAAWPPGRHPVPRSPCLRCGREEDRGRKGGYDEAALSVCGSACSP
jgi:hypothetical protein